MNGRKEETGGDLKGFDRKTMVGFWFSLHISILFLRRGTDEGLGLGLE